MMHKSDQSIVLRSFGQALLLAAVILAGLWLASATTVAVMRASQFFGGQLQEWLIDKGWPRVMRRIALLWAAVFLGIFLKRMGWRGWKDAGLKADDPVWASRPSWKLIMSGIAFGLLSLGSICLLNLLLGLKVLSSVEGGMPFANKAATFIISGISVGLIEELVCRGILFRTAARAWRVWPAAVVVSVLFALAHFVEPTTDSFLSGGFFGKTANIFLSTLSNLPAEPAFWRRFINLTLLGLVLCIFVVKTKSIWFGVGAHAAWVWVIKFHTYLTDPNWDSKLIPWFGIRGDFMDSIVGTLVLIVLASCSLLWPEPKDALIRRRRQLWHVAPESLDEFKAWLDRSAVEEAGRSIQNSALKILKEYEGCEVVATDGWIVKKRTPTRGWKGVRFAIMPPRAKRGFVLGRELTALGIPTPDAVAWSIERRRFFARASHAVTRELKEAIPLTAWLEAGQPAEAVNEVMTSYGRLMALFHLNRYSNRDFKHENVMCSKSAAADLWAVDLDGVRRKLWLSRRRAGKDLMRVGRSLAYAITLEDSHIRSFFGAYNAILPIRLRRDSFPP